MNLSLFRDGGGRFGGGRYGNRDGDSGRDRYDDRDGGGKY